jgi:CBS domain-containing protein
MASADDTAVIGMKREAGVKACLPLWEWRPAAMESCKVKTVLMPFTSGVSLDYAVTPEDRLTHAVQLMLLYGISRIAVVKNGHPMGIVRLDDALEKLGLKKYV